MKQMGIIGLAVAATLSAGAFAAEVQKASVETSKEHPQLVIIISEKGTIAVLKVTKAGILNVQAGDISWYLARGGKTYNCTKGCTIDLSVEGKSVLTVSGDSMLIQNLNTNLTTHGPK